MPGNYDITDKTYIRYDDRIDGDLLDAVFQKYTGVFAGQEWFVPHNLHSTNLLISVWKFDPTNPASFYKIQQYDHDSLSIKWTMPVEGKVVIYSVRDFVGVSMVYEQTSPSAAWSITHNFGTTDILFTVWVNGEAVMPTSATAIDGNNLELVFASPVEGKAVLIVTDPSMSKSVIIDWDQLINVPIEFPPAPHRHQATEIDGLGDIDTLGGHKIDDFLLKAHIGDLVPPLEYESVSDTQKRIPIQYMPTNLFFTFADAAGIQRAQQLTIESHDPHPLFLQKVPGKSEVVLDIYPVVRKVPLMGNVIPNLSLPAQQVEASSDYLIRLEMGTGLQAEAVDLHTLRLSTQQGLAQVFRRASLQPGQTWALNHMVLRTMGEYSLNLYETFSSPDVYDGQSDHIRNQTDIRQPFDIRGDNMLEIVDDVVRDRVLYDTSHYLYDDDTMRNGAGVPISAPYGVDAIYWDPTRRNYMLRLPASTGDIVYRRFNPDTLNMDVAFTIPAGYLPEWNALCGGSFYALMEDPISGTLTLHRDNQDNAPNFSWDKEASFPGEPMPPTAGIGKLIFRVSGGYLVILNTTLNTLAVYSIAAGVKLNERKLPKVAKDFDLWNDGFVSIAFETERSLWVSDTGVFNDTYILAPSIDMEMGMCSCFAINPEGRGGLGLERNSTLRHATISMQTPAPIYSSGETVIWLRSSFAWRVNPFWSQILAMTWKDMDISPYDDIRIGFYPGDHPTLPATLYSWDPSNGFEPFDSADLKHIGQPIDIVDTMQLLGDTTLSYAIYISKHKARALHQGFLTHNFLVRYKTADWMYPVPISGPSLGEHVLVKCGVGALEVTNNLSRPLDGLKLVVVPAV